MTAYLYIEDKLISCSNYSLDLWYIYRPRFHFNSSNLSFRQQIENHEANIYLAGNVIKTGTMTKVDSFV